MALRILNKICFPQTHSHNYILHRIWTAIDKHRAPGDINPQQRGDQKVTHREAATARMGEAGA